MTARYVPPPGTLLRWWRARREGLPRWNVELQQRHAQWRAPHRVKSTGVRARTAREAAALARREYAACYGTYSGAWYVRVRPATPPRVGYWRWVWRDAGFVIGAEKANIWADVVTDYVWRASAMETT